MGDLKLQAFISIFTSHTNSGDVDAGGFSFHLLLLVEPDPAWRPRIAVHNTIMGCNRLGHRALLHGYALLPFHLDQFKSTATRRHVSGARRLDAAVICLKTQCTPQNSTIHYIIANRCSCGLWLLPFLGRWEFLLYLLAPAPDTTSSQALIWSATILPPQSWALEAPTSFLLACLALNWSETWLAL